jgi:hypothetical protein
MQALSSERHLVLENALDAFAARLASSHRPGANAKLHHTAADLMLSAGTSAIKLSGKAIVNASSLCALDRFASERLGAARALDEGPQGSVAAHLAAGRRSGGGGAAPA